MKELQEIYPDKLEIAAVKPVIERKLIAHLIPQKGHTCFELNLSTGEIKPALVESTPDLYGGMYKKVIAKDDFAYVTALNKKNAIKHFKRLLGIA